MIRVEDQFYILATSPRINEKLRVLKHGELFGVFDTFGDIQPAGQGGQGLYLGSTRHLRRFEFRLGKTRPFLLGSTVQSDSVLLAVDLTNPDFIVDDRVVLPRNTLHIFRSTFLRDGVCYHRLRIRNFAADPVNVAFSLALDSDFADIFEVRGQRRERRGRIEESWDGREVVLSYLGLDGIRRRTRILCNPPPVTGTAGSLQYEATLAARAEQEFVFTISCDADSVVAEPIAADKALEAAYGDRDAKRSRLPELQSSNPQFGAWIDRSMSDLHMMTTKRPNGSYPDAGIPWFSAIFGRDGIITALECLWLDPGMARGVLSVLSATQSTVFDPEHDAEPGKIVHEMRGGEMAALEEIPFGRYYGSADGTPLFLTLAGAYYQRTGDLAFIQSIRPALDRALRWIEESGDSDHDGFVEYYRRSPRGLVCQGWKDSRDSVFHDNGALAEGPIALCEVQGYVYSGLLAMALLREAMGDRTEADVLRRRADALQRRFNEAFWLEDLGTYALALDGSKRPCRVVTSNAGHALFSGIAPPDRASRVAAMLFDEKSFSGWGIRTVASSEARYNPMAYHNGSVWPHDNAIIAMGLAQYPLPRALVGRILTAQFDACTWSDLGRLPELFCGFTRRPGEGPTQYPVACSPQSWSAGAVLLLLQATLGLSIDALRREIRFNRPLLPHGVGTLALRNLRLDDTSVDLDLHAHPRGVEVSLARRDGDASIVVVR